MDQFIIKHVIFSASAQKYFGREFLQSLVLDISSSVLFFLSTFHFHYKKFGLWWRIKFISNCIFFLSNGINDKTDDKFIFSTKNRHKKSQVTKFYFVTYSDCFTMKFISSPIKNILWQNILSIFWYIFCQLLSVSSH